MTALPPTDRPAKAPRRPDDAGVVLPWFALTLIVLFAMAGFGVDVWNWWYSAQKQQRAADAGALAGVVFMPGDLTSATDTAEDIVESNGFDPSTVTVSPGDRPNQLQVTVTQTVTNNFVSLLGVGTTTISRSATAEYNAPVMMGSPEGQIGNDPEQTTVDEHWLNIGAPGVNKQTGDRYADYANCSAGVYGCTAGINDEYEDEDLYMYTVEVAPSAAGSNIEIQVYDPVYANGGTTCNSNWGGLTPASIDALQAAFPSQFGADADERYATGASKWCTGDDPTNLGAGVEPQATVWLVRDSSVSVFTGEVNPVLTSGGPGPGGACAKQFKGYDSDFFSLLDPASATYDADFYASFHRWYTVCTIPNAAAGKYFLQVRSAVPLRASPTIANLTTDEFPPETNAIAGQNRYSIRVVTQGTSNYAPGVSTFAEGKLPIYSNVLSTASPPQTPEFYLARLLPGGGATGRVLQLIFYDIGDVGGSCGGPCVTAIDVLRPADALGGATACTWTFDDSAPMPASAVVTGCSVSNMTNAAFNGHLVRANIAVPGDYTCDVDADTGCWFKIQMSYTDGTQANDTTTWQATIGGDPVRLVQ